jgi:hypothetical protein
LTEDEIERLKAEAAARDEFLKRHEGLLWFTLFGSVVAIAAAIWFLTK